MDGSVVWPQKGFLFVPLEKFKHERDAAANGYAELIAPSFDITYAPFFFCEC
jgi:hypothetical protein